MAPHFLIVSMAVFSYGLHGSTGKILEAQLPRSAQIGSDRVAYRRGPSLGQARASAQGSDCRGDLRGVAVYILPAGADDSHGFIEIPGSEPKGGNLRGGVGVRVYPVVSRVFPLTGRPSFFEAALEALIHRKTDYGRVLAIRWDEVDRPFQTAPHVRFHIR